MEYEHTETQLPLENEYPKLVRDNIPEIIKADEGRDVPTRVLEDDDEYLSYLLRKVREEGEELSRATSDTNLQEEIADIYEIIDALIELKGWSKTDITKVQDEKRRRRGGFRRRLLMLGQG